LLSLKKSQASNFRLSKAQRLRTPNDFQRVYQGKQWGHGEHHSYNVLFEQNRAAVVPALGVTVSKKISKLAVTRNQIKRQVKEFYRLRQHQLEFNVELVVTAKPSCSRASVQQRQQSLETLWEKLLKWQAWYKKTQQNTVSADC